MDNRPLYKVMVKHNIVCAIQRVEGAGPVAVPQTKLEVSTQLARNNRERGCIDGEYYFEDARLAKNFAILCLDFAKRLIEKTLEKIEERSYVGEFDWSHPREPHD